jgi:hypothetical protein
MAMATLSQVIQTWRELGYTEDLNLKPSALHVPSKILEILPDDFEIDKTYRFEGLSDPSDSAIAYAISSEKHHVKGILINSFGVYADPVTDKMTKKLQFASAL